MRHQSGDVAFAVADPRNSRQRPVGIRFKIVRSSIAAIGVHVAEKDLMVALKSGERVNIAKVVPFHVRDGNLQNLTLARGAGKGRVGMFHSDVNLAAKKAQALIAQHRSGKQACFEKDLKTVADAKDKPAGTSEPGDGTHHGRKSRDRPGAEIVAIGKTARKDDRIAARELGGLMPDEFDGFAQQGADA